MFKERQFMTAVARFSLFDNAICGSVTGGLYLFRFSALVISGNLDMSNLDLRTKVASHLGTHADRFRSFVDGCWETYVNNVAQSGFWGDHITLVAAAEILGRPISLHSTLPGAGPVLIATTQEHQGQLPIVLVHHHEVHYQAVQEASAGVAGRLQYQSVRGLAAPEPLQEDGRCSLVGFLSVRMPA